MMDSVNSASFPIIRSLRFAYSRAKNGYVLLSSMKMDIGFCYLGLKWENLIG